MTKYIIAPILMSFVFVNAHAKPDNDGSLILSIAGIANQKTVSEGENSDETQMNIGGGILVEAGINDNFGIETGAIALDKQYEYTSGPGKVVSEVRRLHIPVLAKFWLTDYFALSAGPYVSVKIGDTTNRVNIGDVELGSYSSNSEKDFAYGIDAAFTFNIAVDDKTGLFFEARQHTELEAKDDQEVNRVSGLAGIKIDI